MADPASMPSFSFALIRGLVGLWGKAPPWLRRKRTWIPIAFVLAALVVAAGVRIRSGSQFQTIQAKRGPIVEGVYGIGTVTAYRTYQLRFASAQTVRGVFVREGDQVRAGQTMVSTEGELIHSSNAPFGGTVTSIPFKIGEVVPAQTPLLTLTDLADRYIVVSLEQQGAIRVLHGQPAVLSFESLRNQSFRGTVRTVFSNDSQFLVHVIVLDLPERILPGMTADVAIEVARRDDALMVPVAAVTGGTVTVVKNGSRTVVPLKLGTIDGEWAEVLDSPLMGGESLLIQGAK